MRRNALRLLSPYICLHIASARRLISSFSRCSFPSAYIRLFFYAFCYIMYSNNIERSDYGYYTEVVGCAD
jgi:hypothetical protein